MKKMFISTVAVVSLIAATANAQDIGKKRIRTSFPSEPLPSSLNHDTKNETSKTDRSPLFTLPFSRNTDGLTVSVTKDRLSLKISGAYVPYIDDIDLSDDPPRYILESNDKKYILLISENGNVHLFSLDTFDFSKSIFSSEDQSIAQLLKDSNLKLVQVGKWLCFLSSLPEPTVIWMNFDGKKPQYAIEKLNLDSLEGAEISASTDFVELKLGEKIRLMSIPK